MAMRSSQKRTAANLSPRFSSPGKNTTWKSAKGRMQIPARVQILAAQTNDFEELEYEPNLKRERGLRQAPSHFSGEKNQRTSLGAGTGTEPLLSDHFARPA